MRESGRCIASEPVPSMIGLEESGGQSQRQDAFSSPSFWSKIDGVDYCEQKQ